MKSEFLALDIYSMFYCFWVFVLSMNSYLMLHNGVLNANISQYTELPSA